MTRAQELLEALEAAEYLIGRMSPSGLKRWQRAADHMDLDLGDFSRIFYSERIGRGSNLRAFLRGDCLHRYRKRLP